MARNENNNALFILGLILGALIASAILLTSTEDKQKIIKKIKDKFNDLFGETDKLIDKGRDVPPLRDVSTKSKKVIKKNVKKSSEIGRDVLQNVSTIVEKPIQKISVTLPSDVETLNLTPIKELKPKKVFKKSKS